MTRRPMDCLVALTLCCLPALAGCHDKELQSLKAQNDSQRQQIDKLAADMQASEAQREQLQKRADELTTQVQASEAHKEQLQKQLATAGEAATKENESLKTKIAALEKDLAQKAAQIQFVQERIAGLRKELDAASKPPEKPTL